MGRAQATTRDIGMAGTSWDRRLPALSGLGGKMVTEPRGGSGPEGLPEPQTRQGGMREKLLCFPLLLTLSLPLGPPIGQTQWRRLLMASECYSR